MCFEYPRKLHFKWIRSFHNDKVNFHGKGYTDGWFYCYVRDVGIKVSGPETGTSGRMVLLLRQRRGDKGIRSGDRNQRGCVLNIRVNCTLNGFVHSTMIKSIFMGRALLLRQRRGDKGIRSGDRNQRAG